MNPAHLREELLRQHEVLRGLLAKTTELASRYAAGALVSEALAELLTMVRHAFEDHNRYEESVLRPLLNATDAWGPARVDRMIEEHTEEHQAFLEFLDGSIERVAADLADFVEEVEAHMAAEERVFLNVAVLRDPEP